VATQVLPNALWFQEIGQADVFARAAAARTALYLLVGGIAGIFFAANLLIASGNSALAKSRVGRVVLIAVSLVCANLFGSAAAVHWQTFLLWLYGQPFGVVDPTHGKDVGFFVFSLPFERMVSGLLLWLIALTGGCVLLVYRLVGDIGFRPTQVSERSSRHIAALGFVLLLAVAWKIRLAQFAVELNQPTAHHDRTFAGANYVDDHVRLPILATLTILTVLAALTCLAAPSLARRRWTPRSARLIGVMAAVFIVAFALAATWIPSVVQKLVVDPHPLLAEQPYLERSIAATRAGLGLDPTAVEP
jgi:uncharacterized membrane protein (UPF0182 family)